MPTITYEVARAWCWAGDGRPPADLPGLWPWDDPSLFDLDEALAAGWEPMAYVPSISSFGGTMILRREKAWP